MKLKKIFALLLAMIMVSMAFVGCTTGDDPDATTPAVTLPQATVYAAKANMTVIGIKGEVIYSTFEEDEEVYEYSSQYYEPTVLNFLEDYCFMNDDKIEYKVTNGVLKSITIKTKKGDTVYKADAKYEIPGTTDTANTYWLCFINGKEIEGQIDNTMVKDGDEIVLRYTYFGQDLTVTTPPPYVESVPAE